MARNPTLRIRFIVDGNIFGGDGWYNLDDVEVWGSTYCDGAGIVNLTAIVEAGLGYYDFNAEDLTDMPVGSIITCRWDSPPTPVSDFTYVDFLY